MAGARGRSECAGLDAREVVESYRRWLVRAKVACVAADVALGAAAILCLRAGLVPLYFVGLLAVVLSPILLRRRVAARFASLVEIINTDCDAGKWREVVGALRAFSRRRRERELLDLYLAVADCEEMRYAEALSRTESVNAPSKGVVALMYHQGRAVYAHELGDERLCAASVEEIRRQCGSLRAGSAKRATWERALRDLEVGLRAAEEWDEEDCAYVRGRAASDAQSHRERVAWSLHAAALEQAEGNAGEARRVLVDPALEPMTPRLRARRDELLSRCA